MCKPRENEYNCTIPVQIVPVGYNGVSIFLGMLRVLLGYGLVCKHTLPSRTDITLTALLDTRAGDGIHFGPSASPSCAMRGIASTMRPAPRRRLRSILRATATTPEDERDIPGINSLTTSGAAPSVGADWSMVAWESARKVVDELYPPQAYGERRIAARDAALDHALSSGTEPPGGVPLAGDGLVYGEFDATFFARVRR